VQIRNNRKVKNMNNNCLVDSVAIEEAMNSFGTKGKLVFLYTLIDHDLKNAQNTNEIDVR
jgi:hypothetical protein